MLLLCSLSSTQRYRAGYSFCLPLTFGLSSSTSACRAAQAAALLLCPFASSAVPDALKLPPKAKGVEVSRGRRQRSVRHRGWESLQGAGDEHEGSWSALQVQGSREQGGARWEVSLA